MNKKWKDRLGIGHIAKNYVKKKYISKCTNFNIPGKSVQNFTDVNVHVCNVY